MNHRIMRYWQQWLRRWRMPEMKLLFLALLVSVVAVSSVGFFSDRVGQAMLQQATRLLGGDLVINSARPISEDYLKRGGELNLETAETISFRSMVAAGDNLQLSAVKAVSNAYPLQGEFEGSDQPDQAGRVLSGVKVKPGEVWAEPRLFNELNVKPGDTVQLGRKTLVLRQVVTKDPGQGSGGFFQLAPLVLMSLDDLPETGLLSPASRATFTVMFSGENDDIKQLRTELAPNLKPTESIQSLDDGVPTVQQAFQRATRFLGLAALLSVVLAGAAISLTVASLVRHETRPVAVMKALGLSRAAILKDYLYNLWWVALLAGIAGAGLGYILQLGLGSWLSGFANIELPAAGMQPALTGLLTALVMVTGFSLPYLLRLVDTSAMQILRGQFNTQQPLVWIAAISILPAIFLLLWMQAKELTLAIWLFGGLLAALVLFWLVSTLSLRGLIRLSQRPGWEWLSALRHSRRAGLLVVVFAMGLFTLLLLTSLRTDLIARWQASLPDNAPNYFLINIQVAEKQQLEQFFETHQLDAKLYPMVRGRLVEVNGKPILPSQFEDPRSRRLLEREFNLSALENLPKSNQLLEGEWFSRPDQSGFSVEVGIGETLGFGMGDILTFDIAGERYSEQITNIREVRWDSMEPNFFVASSARGMDDKPRTFMTSLHIPADKSKLVPTMVREFPGMTAIDTGMILEQIRRLIDQATFAVQGIFFFTVITGVLVLLAALQAQRPERRQEIAVLKSLGAVHKTLKQRIWGEFLLLGAMAGLMAGFFVMVISNVLGYYLFELDISLNPWTLWVGGLSGMILVGMAAYLNLRRLLDTPPMALLKG